MTDMLAQAKASGMSQEDAGLQDLGKRSCRPSAKTRPKAAAALDLAARPSRPIDEGKLAESSAAFERGRLSSPSTNAYLARLRAGAGLLRALWPTSCAMSEPVRIYLGHAWPALTRKGQTEPSWLGPLAFWRDYGDVLAAPTHRDAWLPARPTSALTISFFRCGAVCGRADCGS